MLGCPAATLLPQQARGTYRKFTTKPSEQVAAPHGISGVEESGKSTFNYRTRWEENIFHSFFFRNSNFLPGTLSSLFLPSSPLSFFSVTRALSKHVYLIILHMHSLACRSFARALKQWNGSVVMNTNRLRSVFL